MAAAPVSLDQGPPLPPQMQAPPQASAQQLAGAQAPASGSLVGNVIQQAMSIETDLLPKIQQTLTNIGASIQGGDAIVQPLLTQLQAFQQSLRKQVGTAIAKGATPPSMNGPLSGGMLMATGAPTS